LDDIRPFKHDVRAELVGKMRTRLGAPRGQLKLGERGKRVAGVTLLSNRGPWSPIKES